MYCRHLVVVFFSTKSVPDKWFARNIVLVNSAIVEGAKMSSFIVGCLGNIAIVCYLFITLLFLFWWYCHKLRLRLNSRQSQLQPNQVH